MSTSTPAGSTPAIKLGDKDQTKKKSNDISNAAKDSMKETNAVVDPAKSPVKKPGIKKTENAVINGKDTDDTLSPTKKDMSKEAGEDTKKEDLESKEQTKATKETAKEETDPTSEKKEIPTVPDSESTIESAVTEPVTTSDDSDKNKAEKAKEAPPTVDEGEEPMEVTPAEPEEAASTPLQRRKKSSTESSPKATPLRKKRTRSPSTAESSKPSTPATPDEGGRVKRQRRQVEKFQAATLVNDAVSPQSPTSVKLYDKGTTLAVRADGASFYLCRCMNHVCNTNKRFKVRWYEIEQVPDMYRLAYEDRVELECVIGPTHLQRAKGGLLRLTAPELARIEQLINAAEKGEDVTKLDPELFKPQTQSVKKMATPKAADQKADNTSVDDDDDTDIEPAEDEPTPKRPRRGTSRGELATPKEKPTRRTRTPKTDTLKTPKVSKGKAKKVAGGKARLKKVVTIAQAAPSMRRVATLQLTSGQKKPSFFSRPSLLRRLSLQRWPLLNVKPKRVKLQPGAPKWRRPPNDPNRKLKHNPRVTVWDKDPLFESRTEVPFVSVMMHSRLAIRAVKLHDTELLKTVIEDTKQVAQVNVQKSCHSDKTTMMYAVLSDQKDVIDMLHKEEKQCRSRAYMPPSLLSVMDTGTYNPRTLPGIKTVRKLNVSRGGREGNNALTKDRSRTYTPDMEEILATALQQNVSYETLKYMVDFGIMQSNLLLGLIHNAVRYGHRSLASKLMEDSDKAGVWGFNFMHKEVLKFNNGEDFTGKLLEASVLKQPVENACMRPIHCAAINPNTKYLSTMLSITSDWNKEDSDKRRPIHYAAACEETGPLKLLIDKHVSLSEADKKGYTPLIIACITGRPKNVNLILEHLIEKEKEIRGEVDENVKIKPPKFGHGGVNMPMKNSWCPIHFAISNKRKEVIAVLLEHGGDVNKNVNAAFNRITPLIMAAQDGELDLVKFLIEKGAKIEKPDKLRRTALIHAVRDGNAHVASYLLNRGADPNTTDSSGNTALHYAAAYGWYFCLKVLLDAGAHPDRPNDWKLTPLGASFLKGNLGLTKILIDLPDVNIDFQDNDGMTLLHHTLERRLYTKETLQEVKLLVIQKKANVKLLDKRGRNAIHSIFAQQLLDEGTWDSTRRDNDIDKVWTDVQTESIETQKEILDILMDHGCDPWLNYGRVGNIFKQTLEHTKKKRPMPLLYHVLWKKPWLPEIDDENETLLHEMLSDLRDVEKLDTIPKFAKIEVNHRTGLQLLKTMAKSRDGSYHKTPLMKLCEVYMGTQRIKSYWDRDNEDESTFNGILEKGRKLIRYLIEDLESEVEYTVVKTKYNPARTYTVLEPLLNVSDPHENFKALNLVLTYKPKVDIVLLDGHTLLIKAVWAGNAKTTQKLLDVGANVNMKSEEKDGSRMTPLLMCLENNNIGLLQILLKSGADRNVINQKTHESAFHIAINKCPDVLDVMEQLYTKDSNINRPNKRLRTPLHLVMNRSTDSPDESKKLEHFMLKNGADPFLKDAQGRLALHYLFVKIGRHTDRWAIDPVESYSIMNIAMKNQQLDEPDFFGQTPLHRAAYRGATVCAMLLIQRGCKINAKDKDGNTPLSLAVWKRHDSCALMMIQKGADINGEVIDHPLAHVNPLHLNTQQKISNGLIPNNVYINSSSSGSDSDSDWDAKQQHEKKKAKQNMSEVIAKNIRRIETKPLWKHSRRHFEKSWKAGKRGYPIFEGLVINGWQGLTFLAMDLLEPFGMQYATVVEIAIGLEKFRFAMNLMEKQLDNEKLRVKNKKGQTLIHALALKKSNCNEDLQELITEDLVMERGVNVNIQDNDGFSALHHAVLKSNETCAYLLINFEGVDLNLTDKFGRNAIAALMWRNGGHWSLCQRMLKKDVKVDVLVDYPPLSIQCEGYEPQIDDTDYYQPYTNTKTTALILAIVRRSHQAVQDFLQAGASSNFADSDGKTPLMYAVQTGDILLVKLLLDPKMNIDHYTHEISRENQRIKQGDIPQPLATDENLFAGMKVFEKKSSLDLNAVDKEGRTALHHMLTTLRYGTYEDLSVLKLLSDAKASLDVKDKAGRTPLDIALQRGARNMANGFQSLLGLPKSEWRQPTWESFTVEDGITWSGPVPNYIADAHEMLVVMEAEEARLAALQPRAIPDQRLGLEEAEVCMDEEIDMPYDILMTKVDVKLGEYGLYNFYKMQVVCDTTKDLYLLFNCWGRIGDRGQYQRTPFKSEEAAKEEFAKIFKAKSGNEWKSVKEFENKPKRYRLIDADYRLRNKQQQVQYDLASDLPSKLSPYIQDLMAELSNISMLRQMMSKIGIDIPFGRLQKGKLIKGREILSELLEVTEKLSNYEENLTTDNIEDYKLVCEEVADLSSEYYYLLPTGGKQYESLAPLKDRCNVEQLMKDLNDLLELEFTGSLLLGAQHKIKEINPYDYLYRVMRARLQQLPQDNTESQTILRYVIDSNKNCDVEAIYRVERSGEPEELRACGVTENHRMLWHGSRTSNLLSILSRGLLIAPKEVPMSGMAFGKGIYTADHFGKSMNYCHNDGNGKSQYMLLCEVALGNIKHVDSNNELLGVLPPEGSNSLQANGQNVPHPAYNTILPTGTEMPLGPLTDSCTPYTEATLKQGNNWYGNRRVNNNEFIVYNEDQVCLRYIVQFR